MKLVASTTRCMKCGNISEGHLCKNCRTITVIDLLVKIANGEELPKRFKFMNKIFNKAIVGDEWFSEDGYSFTESYDNSVLNDEIEILEDKEDNKIEKLNVKYTSQIGKIELANKIDEIIDKINEISGDKNDN